MSDNPKRTRKAAEKIEPSFDATQEAAKALNKAAQAAKPPKRPVGAPTTYNQEIATLLCIRISRGEALRQICNEPGMPDHSVVYDWLGRHPEFADRYTRAREEQADTLADEISSLADEAPRMVIDDKGVARVDAGWVQWQRNRVDARKWIASKLKPKKYSDRMQVIGDKDNPVAMTIEVNQLFDSMLQNVEMTRQIEE